MYPESYPKSRPPKAVKPQITYAFQVVGASILGTTADILLVEYNSWGIRIEVDFGNTRLVVWKGMKYQMCGKMGWGFVLGTC